MPFLPRPSFVLLACVLVFWQQLPSSPVTTPSNPQEQEAPQKTPPSPPANAPKQVPTASRTAYPQRASLGSAANWSNCRQNQRSRCSYSSNRLPSDPRARKIAEIAIQDDAPEVRSAAAAALGEMHARRSIPKLKAATEDKDPSVALAAAHALLLLNDDSGYDVYYEVLTGDRKTGKGALSQAAEFKDPKKLAGLGFHQALGFIPFAGLGWRAFKVVKKDDSSPARA